MAHRLIIKDIENKKIEKIYFLHGEEGFFIDEITKALLKNVLEEHERDFNQTIMYGKDSDVLNIMSECRAYPMMAEKKLVVIKEAQDLKEFDELELYFENPSDRTVFVINYKNKAFDTRKKIAKVIAKNGVMFKSDKVRDYQLPEWITSYVQTVGYSITPKASILLSEYLGSDLSLITNELDKLFIVLEKGTSINDIHIEENIGISKDYNPFELINAISTRDIPKAFAIANYFDHNPKAGDMMMIIPSAFIFFSKLMRIHFLTQKNKEFVASALKIHPFVVSQYLNATKIYTAKKLAANIAILHEYDLKVKGIGNSSFNQGDLMREMIYRLIY